MYRLKLIMVVVLVMLLAACGGGAAHAPQHISSPLVTHSEQAVLGGVTPVSDRIAQALEVFNPVPDALPPLPGSRQVERAASTALTAERGGAQYYEKSGNAEAVNTSVRLLGGPGELSWAVYQLQLTPGATLNRLTITASDGNFSGFDPGYWIGLADYSHGTWSNFIRKHTTDSPFVKTYNLSASQFLSPSGNLYILVLVDGQAATIDNIKLDYEASSWEHVEFGGSANNAGWTPALCFSQGASLMAVYADYATGKARYGIWDLEGSFEQQASWEFMDVDVFDPRDTDIAGATCKWLDMTQDPNTGYPRVSLVYDGVTGSDEDSIIGMSVYVKGKTALFLNYRMGNPVYGAGYTSIDRNPVNGAYVVAHYASNEGSAPPNDMHLRVFQINDPTNTNDDEDISVTKNFVNSQLFNTPCYFPHVRCMADQSYIFSVNGGHMYRYYSDSKTYTEYLADDNSNALGSIADSGQTQGWGYAYVRQAGTQSVLRFLDDLENPSATVHDIDTAPAGQWLGASQLAYKSDGNPGIAYTKYTGSGVEVKLAEYDGAQWTIETITTTPCLPADTGDREAVLVDLDYNIRDQPALIWNQVSGASCAAHIAMRGN